MTYLIRLYALRYKILDIPNDRSSHTAPTPRGGGLAIVITWYTGLSVLYFTGHLYERFYLAFMPGLLLAGISLIDDLINIKPIYRLVIQVVTASISLVMLKGLGIVDLTLFKIAPSFLIDIIVVIGIVWFINLFNFLDGIDGYASIEAILISLVMYIFTGNIVNFILIFSVLGFLIWNWPKAKIFMGDIGSTQLGFILIVLGIYFHNETQLSIIHWIMLTSLFWFDATLTLYRRWRNNEKLTTAHKKHAYQRITQSGFSHRITLLFSILVNLIIIGLVFLSRIYDFLLIPLFILNILVLYAITKLIDRRMPFGKV
ncbi:MAG: glycosyltransferase family 4 protein [Bacteroidales bacterium]|nr:glycosyltransferase family 4 protein [Bacteroidales bacterium]